MKLILGCIFTVALVVGTATTPVGAQNPTLFVWDGGGGNVNWSTSGNWNPDGAPANGSFISVDLAGTAGNQTVDVTGLTIHQMTIGTGFTLSRSAGNTFTWVGHGGANANVIRDVSGGNITINFPTSIAADTTLEVSGSATSQITFSGVLSGGNASSAVLLNGSPTLVLNAQHTFGGGLTIRNGTLAFIQSSTVDGNGIVTSGPIGTGTLRFEGGTLRPTTSGDRTLHNDIVLAGEAKLGSSDTNSKNMVLEGSVLIEGAGVTRTITMNYNSANSATLTGVISDGGAGNALTIRSLTTTQGTLILGGGAADTAANTYSGLTTVTGAGVVAVLNKADGTAAIAGNLTLASGGTVRLGRSNQINDASSLEIGAGFFDLNGFSDAIGALSGSSVDGRITNSAADTLSILTATSTGASQDLYAIIENGAGTVALVKEGTGQLILRSSNTHSGGVTVNAGILVLGGETAPGTGTLRLNGGRVRTLDSVASSRTFANTVEIGGNIEIGHGGTQSTMTLTGPVTLLGTGVTRTITAAANLTDGNRNPVVFGGAIGDGGNGNGLTVAANGVQTRVVMNGNNTYGGATTVSSGTLEINGTHASAVTVASGARLGGTGAISGDVVIQSGGSLSPGSSIGTLTVDELTLSAGAILNFELSNNLTPGATYDQIAGTSLILPGAGTITLNLTGVGSQSISQNNSFTIFTGAVSGFSGTSFQVVNDTDWTGGWQVSEGGSLVLTAIPEPGSIGMLLTAMAGLLVSRRFRR